MTIYAIHEEISFRVDQAIYVVVGSNQDIFDLVDSSNGTGRYFLPEDHGLTP